MTREASAFEDNEQVSLAAFRQALARGEFAMHWEAHGHCYALPRAIDDEIRAGRTVVANVSRTVWHAMRHAYADVVVVSITAPPEVLAERLAARARGSDGARSSTGFAAPSTMPRAAPDVTIMQCRQRRTIMRASCVRIIRSA